MHWNEELRFYARPYRIDSLSDQEFRLLWFNFLKFDALAKGEMLDHNSLSLYTPSKYKQLKSRLD